MAGVFAHYSAHSSEIKRRPRKRILRFNQIYRSYEYMMSQRTMFPSRYSKLNYNRAFIIVIMIKNMIMMTTMGPLIWETPLSPSWQTNKIVIQKIFMDFMLPKLWRKSTSQLEFSFRPYSTHLQIWQQG